MVWECFSDLSGNRSIGFGLGPIEWTAVAAWADRYDLSDDVDWLWDRIAAIDRVFLEESIKQKQVGTPAAPQPRVPAPQDGIGQPTVRFAGATVDRPSVPGVQPWPREVLDPSA